MSNDLSKRIIFFHGDKGGVGKSFSCTIFIDSLLARGCDPIVVEADPRNPDVYRLFKGKLKEEPIRLDLMDAKGDGWMDFIDLIAQYSDRTIVVNLPAGIGRNTTDHAVTLGNAIQELGMKVWVVWTMNRLADSVSLLRKAMSDFAVVPDARWLAIKNGFFGASDKFFRWENSNVRKEFLKASHTEAYLPEVHERVVDAISASDNLMTFSEAAAAGEKVKMSVRLEIGKWLRSAHAIFDVID